MSVALIVVAGLVAVGVGLYFYLKSKKAPVTAVAPTQPVASPSPIREPAPTKPGTPIP
jgi:flagellar basal body-associated protein FliL